jgi:diguanylate cyclase (GGDEF)-like protein
VAIHIPTVLTLFCLICGLIGTLFAGAWYQERHSAFFWRMSLGAYCMGGGVALILQRNAIPDFITIEFADGLMMLGFGLAWSAIRSFNGSRAPLWAVCGGAVLWLAACTVPAFIHNIGWRIGFGSLLAAAYSFAIGFEFLAKSGGERLSARRPMAIILFLHAGLVTLRGVAGFAAGTSALLFEGGIAQRIFTTEPVLLIITLTFFGVGLVRERSENQLRRDAATDELTGVRNRRGLFAAAETLVAEFAAIGRPVAALLFDLDGFKSINDRFGHDVGDRTLRSFAEIATRSIRSDDLFGRIGGEEFAAVLPGVDAVTAEQIANRIRVDFGAADLVEGAATVSVGVATLAPGETSFGALLARADGALYQAKDAGRNRVRSALRLVR